MGMSVVRPLRDGVLENSFTADRMFHWLYRRMEAVNPRRRFSALITCAPFARPVQMEALLAAGDGRGRELGGAGARRRGGGAGRGTGPQRAGRPKLVVGRRRRQAVGDAVHLWARGVVRSSGPNGMGRIDERIERIVRVGSGYRIGRMAAKEIKHTLGSALPASAPRDVIMHMTGFSIAERLPRHFDVETAPVLDACEDVVRELAGLCASVVDNAPEELSADLVDAGAVLVGAGAEMPGLDKRIGDALGIPCRVADAPGTCAIRGLYRIMQSPDDYPAAMLQRRDASAWR